MTDLNYEAKVVHITTVDISLFHMLFDQILFLSESGYDVETISASGPFIKKIINAGITHHSVEMKRKLFSPLRDFWAIINLVSILKRRNYDIVHVHTPKASFLGQLAAWIAGIPIMVRTLHGFYFHEGTQPWLRRIMIILERFAAQFSDAILSQNSEDIETAVNDRICPPERISFLGNGINLSWFDPSRIDLEMREELRKDFQLDPKIPVIGFVGRLVAEKGIPELMQAIRILSKDIINLQVLLVGPVDSEKADAITPEIASKMGLSKYCRFVGFQESMPEIYSLMDVFTLPSHREGYPRSLMEASAMGVPVVATDIRGSREAVRHGDNGLLVPLRNPKALAEALGKILAQPRLAEEMGKNGRLMAQENFDERLVFERVRATYQRLLRE